MKRNSTFFRKVIYLVCIALLLVPLSFISRPAMRRVSENNVVREDPGGWLARMRKAYHLTQSDLGEVDPAGASINLATLGMRGVAAHILWTKAIYYKKTEDWSNMKAALNQIAKLQPHFVSVWRFQSWQLSYNVAAEFDDYHQRYHWVKKGVEYLLKGIRYNRSEPLLLWEMGWFFGHKLGRSDDRLQFRELYRHDDDFHKTLPINMDDTRGPDGYPDTWLTAWIWYGRGQQLVDTGTIPLRGKNPLIFHSDPSMALIYYAIAIEKDGYLDEKGQEAWRRAGQSWHKYGNRAIRTGDGQHEVRLNDLDRYIDEIAAERKKLDQLCPGVRQQLLRQRRAKLSDDERKALDTPVEKRTMDQMELADTASTKLEIHPQLIVDNGPQENRKEASRIATKLLLLRALARAIDGFRTTVNYDYWAARCASEQEDTTVQARKYLQEAQRLSKGNYHDQDARKAYETAWDLWAEVYDKYPLLMDDPTAEDVVKAIDDYRELLDVRFEESFPPPGFKLNKLLEINDSTYHAPVAPAKKNP